MANIKQTVDFSQGTLNNLVVVNNKLQLSSVAAPSFTRNSIAYKNDGTLVNTNIPRFEQGRFGKAIMVEELATNLLTANQSSVEGDLSGLRYYNATVVRDTSTAWQGRASAKVTVNAQSMGGLWTQEVPVQANTTYTFSCYLKGSNQVRINFEWYNSSMGFLESYNGTICTLSSNWQRCSSTATSPANAAYVRVTIYTPNTSQPSFTFWVDGLQLEQKPYATSWTLGGTTRSAEILVIPTAGVLNPQKGTVEFTVIPQTPHVNPGGDPWFNDFTWGTPGTNGFLIRRGVDTGAVNRFHVEIFGTPAGTVWLNYDATFQQGTPYTIAFRWSASGCAFFVDGVKRAETTYLFAAPSATEAQIGYRPNYRQGNALYDDLRISSRARTDEEIAAAYASGQPLPVDEWTTYLLRFDDNLNYGQGGYYISPEYDVSSVNKAARGKVYWQEDADGMQRIVYAKLDNQADWTQVTNGGLLPISAGDVLTNRKLQLKVKMLKVI